MGSRNLWEELKEKFREISKNNVPELNQNDDVPKLNQNDDVPKLNQNDDVPELNQNDDVPKLNQNDDVPEPNQNVEIRRYPTSDKNIFYVLVNENECCRLEFRIQYGNRYQDMIQKLKPKFPLRDFEYRTYYTNSIWIQRQRITKADELEKDLKKMTDIIIKENLKPDTGQQDAPPVRICVMTAEELLKKPIQIPDYQRPYCWKEKNVRDFLVDIDLWKKDKGDSGIPYHLGTIILKEKEENGGNATLDIIDGQQRLTTMAIVKFCQMQEQPPLLNSKKNYTESEKETILRARNYIKNSKIEIDFTGIVLSVVILRKNQPEDLAYTFFSNSNSTGKRLSDYDLLKNHHLRYISSDRHAERFSKRWHELEKSGCQDDVLQKMLFRLRKWSNNEIFPFEACNREERDIFNHFKSVNPLRDFPADTLTSFRFNSLLSGGKDFFYFVEHYRRKYHEFMQFEDVKILGRHLSWHSNGVICAGIRAIAFLFFCKFGDLYLREAIYLLAYRLSELRNETQVRSAYLSNEKGHIFRETTRQLEQVTREAQFFALLSDVEKRYERTNKGQTADRYWKSLDILMEALKEMHRAVNEINFKQEKSAPEKEKNNG